MEQEAKDDSQTQVQEKPRLDMDFLQKRVQRNADAFKSGEKAKRCGWYEISPYYDDPVSDDFFHAGFRGVPWEKAIRGEFAAS